MEELQQLVIYVQKFLLVEHQKVQMKINTEEDISWLNTKEINFNRIYDTEKHITQEGFDNSAAKWEKKIQLLLLCIMQQLRK